MDRVAVAADERPAPIVHAHSVLPTAAGQLELQRAGVEKKTLAANGDRFGILAVGPAYIPTSQVGRNVKTVVEAPMERVQHRLAGFIATEAGVDDLADGCCAVAPIFAIENVRGGADEDAAVVASNGGRRVQVIDVNRAHVVTAGAGGVFEQTDAAMALVALVCVVVVLRVLDDEHPAVLVEVDGDRRLDQRLGGDQLNAKARPELEALERLGRRLWRNPRHLGGVVLIGTVLLVLDRISAAQRRGLGK